MGDGDALDGRKHKFVLQPSGDELVRFVEAALKGVHNDPADGTGKSWRTSGTRWRSGNRAVDGGERQPFQ